MRTLARRTLFRIGTTAVLVFLAVTAHLVVAPATAHARCDGHTEIRSQLFSPRLLLRAEEWPQAGTCNSNNAYHGYIRSLSPSWRVTVWIQNGGDWDGYSCRYGSTCTYSFTDTNYYSYIHLCIDNAGQYICGWGQQSHQGFTHQTYGIIWGF